MGRAFSSEMILFYVKIQSFYLDPDILNFGREKYTDVAECLWSRIFYLGVKVVKEDYLY